MSSAPVEILAMEKAAKPAPSARRGLLCRLCAMLSARPRGGVTFDGLCFLFLLGISASVLGFGLDLTIEKLGRLRLFVYEELEHAQTAENATAYTLARAAGWVGHYLVFSWAAIAFTARLAPQARRVTCGHGLRGSGE